MRAKIIGKKLLVDGYVYLRSSVTEEKIYWDCNRVRNGHCTARAITNNPTLPTDVIVLKGPSESKHTHAPNQEEVKAQEITYTPKTKAADNLEISAAQLHRTELEEVSCDVLSQLPECEAWKKQISRERRKDLPTNPKSLQELQELPEAYQKNRQGEKFLIYDSGMPVEDDDEVQDEGERMEEEDGEDDEAAAAWMQLWNTDVLSLDRTKI